MPRTITQLITKINFESFSLSVSAVTITKFHSCSINHLKGAVGTLMLRCHGYLNTGSLFYPFCRICVSYQLLLLWYSSTVFLLVSSGFPLELCLLSPFLIIKPNFSYRYSFTCLTFLRIGIQKKYEWPCLSYRLRNLVFDIFDLQKLMP